MSGVLDDEAVPVEHERDRREVPDGVGVEQAEQGGEVVHLSTGVVAAAAGKRIVVSKKQELFASPFLPVYLK